jgi:metal-responsive CopG/Arc/MetJ family transcriptional regulator
MRTIAIAVDEPTLQLLEELAALQPGRRRRSAVVRAALREYAGRERRRHDEERERQIFRKHRKLLDRQARALVRPQARP